MTLKFSKTRSEPVTHPANPGQGPRAEISCSGDDDDGTPWEETEEIDLPDVLRETLAKGGWAAARQDDWVITDSGFWLKPWFVFFDLDEETGTFRTTTTIEVAHPTLLSAPCFEYQHAASKESVTASVRDGLAQWMGIDWPVFDDLAASALNHCTAMEMSFPQQDGAPACKRRVLFGPVGYRARKQAAEKAQDDEHPPFCPCCLFTNTWEAFESQLRGSGTFGLRLYAARDAAGELMADCRVNGEDWPAGAQALRQYAAGWPDRGFESRKQYVLIGPAAQSGP